ncbi:hypothetical protein HDV02_002029 [Globomyces sp. JEL0801]|nr:hypothetical protein HDV02_002029 [Globomyces sp. JEL0801]
MSHTDPKFKDERESYEKFLSKSLVIPADKAKDLATEVIEKFLPIKRFLNDYNPEYKCSPSPIIDEAWHALLLFTEFYQNLCGSRFIHYNPMCEFDTIEEKAGRYNATLHAYRNLFEQIPDSDFWPEQYPGYGEIKFAPIKIKFQMFINMLTGKTVPMSVLDSNTIGKLKTRIRNVEIPKEKQTLMLVDTEMLLK